ncbi:isochorismate synthase DhbC [Spartinivicinus poritis]|uniref:isochorismate synthase n=1 Tax=Spartinivicinus poritis TaxID=2994640 RepID=A0ABT5U688_9GAMM|nr:isochorismate synthase DhbC [Spartinivicinus sp. A2-2]MDE1460694.1 isochorismate synthase DhbC [Spartinivicinus sp. A2-2]
MKINYSELIPTGSELISHYDPNDFSFFFGSPKHALLARGVQLMSASTKADSGLPEAIQAMQAKAREKGYFNPIVVGAIPFDTQQNAQLVIPEYLERTRHVKYAIPNKPTHNHAHQATTITQIPAAAEYKAGVAQALKQFRSSELSKVVLSRSLQVTTPAVINAQQLLAQLAADNTTGYTFAVNLPTTSDRQPFYGRMLLGASPELLVSRSGTMVQSNPLAGSIPRSSHPKEDQQRAAGLLESAKDLYEHAVVVDAVAAALRPYCKILDVPAKPSVISTATMWHLSTFIQGELLDPATSSLTLAHALHPTPAVCGYPPIMAKKAIKEIESFDRGFFTGMLGWCDSHGDGEWIVTIRCAEVAGNEMTLFAGAGIVEGSCPESEWNETGAKFRTMLNAIGIAPLSEVNKAEAK